MTDAMQVKACSDCDAPLDEDADVEPLYECGQCGTTFGKSNSADGESARCPDCNKFSSRIGETHEGCEASIEDAEDKWQCGSCEEVHDTEEEAEQCCTEEEEEEVSEPAAPVKMHGLYRRSEFCEYCGHERVLHGKSPYGWPTHCNKCPNMFCAGKPEV